MAQTLAHLRSEAVRLHQAGETAKAARVYAAYLAQTPEDASMWSNLGVLHRRADRHRMALRVQRRAFAIAPDDPAVRNNMANILSDTGDYDGSLALRYKALADQPDDAAQLAMIGRCNRGKGDYAAAIAHLKDAHTRFPNDAEIEMQLAFAELGAGAYADGMNHYRARWRAGELKPRDIAIPEWQGEDVAGKTVLVLPEQGFGDAVLFARFLPALKARGCHVVLACKRPLQRLFADLDGCDTLATQDGESAGADYYVNMMDLAALHFAADTNVPAPTRLSVPDAAIARARGMVQPYRDRLRVGVVWTGSVTYKGNAFRSFSHRNLLPLTDLPGVQLFSLYKGPELDAFYADGADSVIVDAGASESDFADCAAMMREMDLVITSDTATAHIAGSLGVPAWVVLHWDAFWVWRHSGETTAWYPSLRLYRQHEPMDWTGVLGDVAQDLRAMLGET